MAQIAAGFGISGSTAHAYTTAVTDLVVERAPGLLKTLREADPDFVLLDGTLAECDRVGDSHLSPARTSTFTAGTMRGRMLAVRQFRDVDTIAGKPLLRREAPGSYADALPWRRVATHPIAAGTPGPEGGRALSRVSSGQLKTIRRIFPGRSMLHPRDDDAEAAHGPDRRPQQRRVVRGNESFA